ncbi:nitroreductase family protein [Fusobacterium gastrosuis]|uniref:nitroreductase family protein n=1 Tax=Fusobacterium gastrosuis TaxID=1755100 RepID=UPI002A9EA30E|nr:nitroreductase family protein [Fusobacterium gastrosuis]
MVLDLIKKSRTHRHFLETSVDEKDILKILSAARYSASGKNKQILRYAFTTDDSKCKEIFKNIALGGALKANEKPTIEERPRAAIVIATDDGIPEDNSTLFFNIGIVSQNITLTANDLGFSTCTIMSYNKKEIDKILNLPENYSSKAVIILGIGKEDVEIVDIRAKDDSKYYRKEGKHFVPKIVLEDLIIGK